MRIVEFVDRRGDSPFAAWFLGLDPRAASKVTTALARLEAGNLSNVKAVGQGVQEYRIDWGPGYRIYFGRRGEELVVLLAGGTKQRQGIDIARAIERWHEYRQRGRE